MTLGWIGSRLAAWRRGLGSVGRLRARLQCRQLRPPFGGLGVVALAWLGGVPSVVEFYDRLDTEVRGYERGPGGATRIHEVSLSFYILSEGDQSRPVSELAH